MGAIVPILKALSLIRNSLKIYIFHRSKSEIQTLMVTSVEKDPNVLAAT